jgi:hypothetical protein
MAKPDAVFIYIGTYPSEAAQPRAELARGQHRATGVGLVRNDENALHTKAHLFW